MKEKDKSNSSEDGDDDESYEISKRNIKKENKDNKNVYGKVPLNYNISMTNIDPRSLVNVLARKLPQFDGTNFEKWKHMIKTYLIGLHPELWEIVRNGLQEPQDPSSLTPLEYRWIHLNAQATSALLSALSGVNTTR
jgi:hypothetical protein